MPHWPDPRASGPTHPPADRGRRAPTGRGRRPDEHHRYRWAGPTLLRGGPDGAEGALPLPLLAGEEIWCQLFSEPGAGSDLAAVTTRGCSDGDEWVVQGNEVWTTYARAAAYGILFARTEPGAPTHQGISYFIRPMDAAGVTVRPFVRHDRSPHLQRGGAGRRAPAADNLVGRTRSGWASAKVTLGNERVSLSGAGALWGMGPTGDDLVGAGRRSGGTADPLMRQRLAALWGAGQILRLAADAHGVGGRGRDSNRDRRPRCARP